MTHASYNEIAEWYDSFLRERPVYTEVLLPNLLALIGAVEGEVICDLACGQGWVARELARRGARVTGLDLATNLLALARRYEEREPLGIEYVDGDAQRAEPLGDQQFTGCVCVMALINIPDLRATFQTVRRILRPEGWFVFAISHPCFETPHAQWVASPDPEHPLGRLVTGYFDERAWVSSNPEGVRSRVADNHRMLSTYLNGLCGAGFVLERALEPGPSERQAERVPGNREVPTLLLIRARLAGD
jgi:ubiquinone/menaquinone biosynthesis C-methylase UbiE